MLNWTQAANDTDNAEMAAATITGDNDDRHRRGYRVDLLGFCRIPVLLYAGVTPAEPSTTYQGDTSSAPLDIICRLFVLSRTVNPAVLFEVFSE